MSNKKERKHDGVWDARRVLYNVLFYADEEGRLKYVTGDAESTNGIKRQRFNAALKAYGKIEKDDLFGFETGLRIGNEWGVWISKTRSQEKMEELYELLKQNMRHDFIMRGIDVSHFLKEEHDRLSFFRKLFKYRKELYALDMIWSGVLECSRPIGMVIETTDFLFHNHIRPACDVIDRMLILLMGDDFDKTFTEKELLSYGYPDVTDDELYQISLKEEW